MSGSRSNPAERHLAEAEQHLGDRLAALVDGELGHDARERVLAHLATCAMCKTEADAQRRLKSVFAQTAPPPPSDSFLARLQGLPGGDPSGPRSPFGDEGFATGSTDSAGLPPSGLFGSRAEPFEYVPSGAHAAVLPSAGRGFRIHDVSRHEAERSAWRGRRFAFAAAGAVSLAAIALGGVSAGVPTDTTDRASGSGSNSNVTPQRSAGTGASAATPDSLRRRGPGPFALRGQRPGALSAPVSPTEAAAPLLPGVPSMPAPPADGGASLPGLHELTAPLSAGAAVMSPLIRPATPTPPSDPSPSSSASPSATAAAGPVVPPLGAAGAPADPAAVPSSTPLRASQAGSTSIR
ncbi:anti-sigma factor family protein [Actinomycetota bacterium Odt1-20B]